MKYLLLILSVILFFASCKSDEEPKPLDVDNLQEPTKTVDPPSNSTATTMGNFTSFAHGLSGKAVIYTNSNNTRTLRLEEFNMTPGPDVYVFLSRSNNYSEANTTALAQLKDSYSKSNLDLTLDNSIDLTTHRFVLVYCVEFSSLFGYAELK